MPNSTPEAVVTAIYRRFLDRDPVDAAGYQHNLQVLKDGEASVRGLVKGFMCSSEYSSRFLTGHQPNEAIEMAYQRALGRAADPEGMTNHLHVLQAFGWPAVVNSIVDSVEYLNAWGEYKVPGSGLQWAMKAYVLYTSTRENWPSYPHQETYNITPPPGYRMIDHRVWETTLAGNARWGVFNETPNGFQVTLWIAPKSDPFAGASWVGVKAVLFMDRP